MIAIVISDSIFATIIGVSFTGTLGLMAWIVKTLSSLDTKVETMDDRLERVEKAEAQRQREEVETQARRWRFQQP